MISLASFQQEIELQSRKKLDLKINDNCSTMLSVKWEPDRTKVSMHRIFLQAPQNVMDALSCYILQEHKLMAPTIRAFIEEKVRTLDYSHTLNLSKLYTQGNVYNLQKIYDRVNDEYFCGKIDLKMTWFGKPSQRNRSRFTFGLYVDTLKLIKIHTCLDSPAVPDYFISYVVYHEMLHHVYPAYIDEEGIRRVHGEQFKEKEKEFRYYALAKDWLQEHREHLFI